MKFVRFLAVGVFNTACSATLFLALFQLLPHHPISTSVSQGFSYAAGILIGFRLHRAITYKPNRAGRQPGAEIANPRTWLRFLVIDLALLLGTALSLTVAVDGYELSPAVSWLIVATSATVIKFLLLGRFVFPQLSTAVSSTNR